MAYLNPNSFYSSFARKGKGSGSVPQRKSTPGTTPSGLGVWGPGHGPKPATAPSAPTAPSGPGSSSSTAPTGFTVQQGTLPPDPAYQLTLGGLTAGRDNTLAGLAQQRGAGLSQYGYTEDPATHAIAFDPNNPYSQAALLRQHYQQSKTGNTNRFADSGQGYAGSLQNAQNAATDNFNRSDNGLTQAVINFLANNTQAATAAGNQFDLNSGLALGQSVQNAPNNPLYSPASAAGSGGGLVSGNADGNMAITAAHGPLALMPSRPNSTVQLASGWSIVYGPDGRPVRFIPPGG